jgi:3-deoxy-D-manno-octulosonic-acid transferase
LAIIYNIIINLYNLLIHISGIFNPKAKKWVQGRKGIFKRIAKEVNPEKNLAWFHCASLGEFEQGRPVIEAFKNIHPDYRIIVTFFSPSGFEVRKNYEGADHIYYLPIDTASNAKKFIELTRPKMAFFIKYEYWFNYILQLRKQQIPVFGVSSIFRPGQRFFRWYGSWQRRMLKRFTHFFVQDVNSKNLLIEAGINQVTVSGDTRFDRVYEIAGKAKAFPLIEKFKGNNRIFIAGSTWPPDETLIFDLIRKNPKNLKFIIAPHEVHKERINGIMKQLPAGSLRFSEINASNVEAAMVIVVDNIGILSHLYQYGDFAHIGGGFGVGIHNILEAATFGLPVIFGPNYQKFREARDLIGRRGAFAVSDKPEFSDVTEKIINDKEVFEQASRVCKVYVEEKRGASDIIMEFVDQYPGF